MKRTEFEAQFEELGLNLSPYGDSTAYYGALPEWSLSLSPFGGERVQHAKLAIDAGLAKKNRVFVDTFLSAAHVERTPEIDEALASGREFREQVGSKVFSVFEVGRELVLNVLE